MSKPLSRLISAARKAEQQTSPGVERPQWSEAPLGFGTRVAALWASTPTETIILFERWAWHGLVCAAAICVFTALAQDSIASSEANPAQEAMALPGEELF